MASLCRIILAVSLVESAGGRDFQSHMGEKQMSASRIACMGAAYETTAAERIIIVAMFNFMVIEPPSSYTVFSYSLFISPIGHIETQIPQRLIASFKFFFDSSLHFSLHLNAS